MFFFLFAGACLPGLLLFCPELRRHGHVFYHDDNVWYRSAFIIQLLKIGTRVCAST